MIAGARVYDVELEFFRRRVLIRTELPMKKCLLGLSEKVTMYIIMFACTGGQFFFI